jgi:Uma2 family endonuclease
MVAMIEMTKAPVPLRDHVPDADDVICLHTSWRGYLALLSARGDTSGPRMHYLDQVVEIMSPSTHHETRAYLIARLLEVYLLARDIPSMGYKSWTLKRPRDEAGVEPDECFMFGEAQDKPRPDLAIEVVWSGWRLDKLEIYRRIGVPEVWVWEDGTITVHELVRRKYKQRTTSAAFPDLDLALICRLAQLPTLNKAIAEMRKAVSLP